MNEQIAVAVGLLLAHLVTDFVLQGRRMLLHKRRYGWKSLYLIIHAAIAGFLALLFTWQWENWLFVFGGTMVTHWLIDLLKIELSRDSLRAFLTDQAGHIAVAAGIWFLLFPDMWHAVADLEFRDPKLLAYLTGLLLITRPAGFLVEHLFQRWSRDLRGLSDSLPGAGAWIGYLERLLVFLFILVEEYAGIGLLITAKSILRFRDTQSQHKITEYILLGTLLSFSSAIGVALAVSRIISLL